MTQPILSFSVLSDIHIKYWDTDSHQKFKHALLDHHTIDQNSDVMVINGDLTNGDPRDYQTLQDLLEQTEHPPIHATIGNHEFYRVWFDENDQVSYDTMPNGWSSEKSIHLFNNFTGYTSPYHDFWLKGYHFIFLSSEGYRDLFPEILEDAYITDDQFTWLEEKLSLKLTDSNKPIFLFLHQPLPNTLSGTSNPNDQYVLQHERLRHMLNQYPEVVYFSGHTHYGLHNPNMYVEDRFAMVGSAAVIGTITQENGGPVSEQGRSQSLHVNVFTDRIEIRGRCHKTATWIDQAHFVRHY